VFVSHTWRGKIVPLLQAVIAEAEARPPTAKPEMYYFDMASVDQQKTDQVKHRLRFHAFSAWGCVYGGVVLLPQLVAHIRDQFELESAQPLLRSLNVSRHTCVLVYPMHTRSLPPPMLPVGRDH
jgi:hypothetical protein